MIKPLSLEIIWQELKKNTRRINSLQAGVDTLNNDREILEDIQGRLTGLEEKFRLSRQHDIEATKDIKAAVNLTGERMETKVEEIHDEIGKKKVIKLKPGWFRLPWQKRR